MTLTDKQISDLNNMNVAAQNVGLGDIIAGIANNVSNTRSAVKVGKAVPDAKEEIVTKSEFNALLNSLRSAGIIEK